MVNLKLKYLVEDVDRHGNVRVYFRRPGFAKIRLRGLPGSEQFNVAYAAALANANAGEATRNMIQRERGSLEWLCFNYYRSPDFRRLCTTTQRVRRLILDGVCNRGAGPLPFNKMTRPSACRSNTSRPPDAARCEESGS